MQQSNCNADQRKLVLILQRDAYKLAWQRHVLCTHNLSLAMGQAPATASSLAQSGKEAK